MQEQQKKLKDLVRKAFKNWHLPTVHPPDLFTELLSIPLNMDVESDAGTPEHIRSIINSALREAVDALALLEAENPIGSTVLRSRFLDKQPTAQVAAQIKENEYYVNRAQAKAIEQVADFLWAREQSHREKRSLAIASRLFPSKYDILIGRDDEHQQLTQMLLSAESDWLITLIGMGGIGKTALVDSVLRGLISTFFFYDIVQVSIDTHPLDRREGHDPVRVYEILLAEICARLDGHSQTSTVAEQELLVNQMLNERRYLIVIDNVEEVGDATLLTEKFGAWVKPSKVLIMSRVRPKTGKFRPFPLKDLSEADALTLMRHEIASQQQTDMALEDDDTLRLIFEHTGGNPYAIKLLIGMLRIWSVPQTIAAIKRGKAERIENLFDHIFKAAWQTLSESTSAQEVLLSMALAGASGATAEDLVEFTGLPTDDVLNAIDKLSDQSLIEVYGDLKSRSYGIHRLTETFLQQIIYGTAPGNSSNAEQAATDEETDTPDDSVA